MICPCPVASFATHLFSSTSSPVSFSKTALMSAAEAATRLRFSRPSSELWTTPEEVEGRSCERMGTQANAEMRARPSSITPRADRKPNLVGTFRKPQTLIVATSA